MTAIAKYIESADLIKDKELEILLGYDIDPRLLTHIDDSLDFSVEGFLKDAFMYLWNALVRLFRTAASYLGEIVEKFLSVDFLMKQKIDYNSDNLQGLFRSCNNDEKKTAEEKFRSIQAKFMLSFSEWESYLKDFNICTKYITSLVHEVITTDTVNNVPESNLDIVNDKNILNSFSTIGIDITDIGIGHKNVFTQLTPTESYGGLGFVSIDYVIEVDNKYTSLGWNSIRIVQSNRRELERHVRKLEYELSRAEQYTKVSDNDDKKENIKNRLMYTRKALGVIRMCTLYLVQIHRQFSRRRSTLIKDASLAVIKALPKTNDD